MDRRIDEDDHSLDHQYGDARDTELYEMILAQFTADRAAADATDARSPDLAPMHLWLIIEGMARRDPRLDWRAERALLATNRWVRVLYDADEVPSLGDPALDDEYAGDRIDEDSPAGCRTRLIALLGVLDGPDVTCNFDVDGLVADVRTATGGNDPLALAGDTLLSMAETRRFSGR